MDLPLAGAEAGDGGSKASLNETRIGVGRLGLGDAEEKESGLHERSRQHGLSSPCSRGERQSPEGSTAGGVGWRGWRGGVGRAGLSLALSIRGVTLQSQFNPIFHLCFF